jgi:hypothetical protein
MNDKDIGLHMLVLSGISGLIGVGQALLSPQQLHWRILLGKSICSAGLGGSAALLGVFHTGATFELQIGLACALATMGSDVLTKIVVSRLSKSTDSV